MNYYFDESGNWSDCNEKKRLVLGGLLLKDTAILSNLDREFAILKAENRIKTLHASELTPAIKESCYRIIDSHLSDETEVLMKIYDPSILFSKTRKNKEEIYSDLAATLVSDISYGDENILIYYDMKFHYAYPLNIIKQLHKSKPFYYKEIKRFFSLTKLSVAKKHVLRKVVNTLAKSRIAQQDKTKIKQFELLLHHNDKFVSDYLWTELWLRIEGNEVAKENFRATTLRNFKSMNKMFGVAGDPPQLKLYFEDKSKENAGVQVIDFICNLVYRHGAKPTYNASDAVKSILNKITIEEVS